MKAAREYLGVDQDMAGRRKVFRIVDALETDEASFLRIERTRVYFDDVLAITRHREYGVVFLTLCGFLSVALIGAGLAVWAASEQVVGLVFFCVFAAPFFIGFILRAALGVEVVSIYGRRTMTRVKFWFRKEKANEVFETLVAECQSRQQKNAPPPPAAPPLPPPPPIGPA